MVRDRKWNKSWN